MTEIHTQPPKGFVPHPLELDPTNIEGFEALDSFPVRLDETHIPFVLDKIAAANPQKDLYLFTNCLSQIVIDGVVIARQFDTMLASKEADMVIMTSRDADLVSAVSLADALEERNISYTIINGKEPEDDFVDDADIRGFLPVRYLDVLEEAVELAHKEGVTEAGVYPNVPWSFNIGYGIETKQGDFEFVPIYTIGGTGLVDTGHFSLIMDNGSEKNLKPDDLPEVVQKLGLTPIVHKSGHPEYVKPDKSITRRLTTRK